MMARLTSALLAVGLFMFTVLSVAAVAGTYTIELPYLIVGGPSERVVFEGPVGGAGEVCTLVFSAANDVSPHKTDLRFESNGQIVMLYDVERESGAVTTGDATIVHDGHAVITRVVHDRFSSLEGSLELQCLPVTTTTITTTTVPVTTTSVTLPPTTSTTSTTTTVTTVPPPSTTSTTVPPTTTTSTPPTTTVTTSSTTVPPTTNTSEPPPPTLPRTGISTTQTSIAGLGSLALGVTLVLYARRELA